MVNLSSKLSNTRKKFSLFGKSALSRSPDDSIWQEIEETLISADLGVRPSLQIVESLKEKAKGENITTLDELTEILKNQLKATLSGFELSLDLDGSPAVRLLVGTNGVGKTTTIGKIGKIFRENGNEVLFSACDTFRAAAIDQLEKWSEKVNATIIKSNPGSDPASVAYKALEHAKKNNINQVLIDTAGRLQNKKNLMDEFKKIANVIKKSDETAPVSYTHLTLPTKA